MPICVFPTKPFTVVLTRLRIWSLLQEATITSWSFKENASFLLLSSTVILPIHMINFHGQSQLWRYCCLQCWARVQADTHFYCYCRSGVIVPVELSFCRNAIQNDRRTCTAKQQIVDEGDEDNTVRMSVPTCSDCNELAHHVDLCKRSHDSKKTVWPPELCVAWWERQMLLQSDERCQALRLCRHFVPISCLWWREGQFPSWADMFDLVGWPALPCIPGCWIVRPQLSSHH